MGNLRRMLSPRILQAFACSDPGLRDENQDNYLLLQEDGGIPVATYLKNSREERCKVSGWPRKHLRLAVADGMGGHRQGRELAEEVIQQLLLLPPQEDIVSFRQTVFQVHQKVCEVFPFQGEYSPGCTLVWVDLDRKTGQGVGVSVGDSRIYQRYQGVWRQRTWDHTGVEFSWRDGELEEELYHQALQTGAGKLAQAMGFGSMGLVRSSNGYKPFRFSRQLRLDLEQELLAGKSGHADVIPLSLQIDDLLLLSSDGLWSHGPTDFWNGFPSLELVGAEGIRQWVKMAVQQGATDNVTVVGCAFRPAS